MLIPSVCFAENVVYDTDFPGSDVGERINNALLSFGEEPGKVIVSLNPATQQFSTTILFNSKKTIDFQNTPLEYTGTQFALAAADKDMTRPNTVTFGNPVLDSVILNLTLKVSNPCTTIVNLTAVRNCIFKNWRLSIKEKTIFNEKSAMIWLRGAHPAKLNKKEKETEERENRVIELGPGGSHYNIFERINMYANGQIDYGLRVKKIDSDSRSCNYNVFNRIYVVSTNGVGIYQLDGWGNAYYSPGLEQIAGKNDDHGTAMKIRGKDTTIIAPYVEYCKYAFNTKPENNTTVIGGFFAEVGDINKYYAGCNIFPNRE